MDFPQQQSQTDNKKRYVIIITVALLVIIAVAIALFLKGREGNTDAGDGVTIPVSGTIVPNISGQSGAGATGTTGKDAGELLPKREVLSKLWDAHVAGYSTIIDASSTKVLLFDSAQGIFAEVDAVTGAKKPLVAKSILGVHDAYFLSSNKVILRKLDDEGVIRSMVITLIPSEGSLPYVLSEPVLLSSNIREIGVSPNGVKAVFVIDDGKSGLIHLYDATTGAISEVAKLAITEWIPNVQNDGKIILSAKASDSSNSGMYELKNGRLLPMVSMRRAQTTLYNAKDNTTFVSYRGPAGFLGALERPNFISDLVEIPFATITEKCAFGSSKLFCGVPSLLPPSGFPDGWYMGQHDLHDALYMYDFNTEERTLVASPWSLRKENLDMVNVQYRDPAFFFVDKKTGALYRAYTNMIEVIGGDEESDGAE